MMILFLEVSYIRIILFLGSFIFKIKIIGIVFVTRTAVAFCHEIVQQTYNHQNQKDYVNGLSRLEVLTQALQQATAEKTLTVSWRDGNHEEELENGRRSSQCQMQVRS